MCEYHKTLKPHIVGLLKIEERKNRVEHCFKFRDMKDFRRDDTLEKNDATCSCSCSTVAMGRAESTIAQDHRTRGNQHCLIVF